MEIRTDILQQLTQALTPGFSPPAPAANGSGTPADQVGPSGDIFQPAQLQNVGAAINTGDANLLLSAQEKDILEVLFVKQGTNSGSTGFRLYSSQVPRQALRGSFVDLKG